MDLWSSRSNDLPSWLVVGFKPAFETVRAKPHRSAGIPESLGHANARQLCRLTRFATAVACKGSRILSIMVLLSIPDTFRKVLIWGLLSFVELAVAVACWDVDNVVAMTDEALAQRNIPHPHHHPALDLGPHSYTCISGYVQQIKLASRPP